MSLNSGDMYVKSAFSDRNELSLNGPPKQVYSFIFPPENKERYPQNVKIILPGSKIKEQNTNHVF